MTKNMQQLLSRVDGTPPLIRPTTILGVPSPSAASPPHRRRSTVGASRLDERAHATEDRAAALVEPTRDQRGARSAEELM
jgi:hypothetical protein